MHALGDAEFTAQASQLVLLRPVAHEQQVAVGQLLQHPRRQAQHPVHSFLRVQPPGVDDRPPSGGNTQFGQVGGLGRRVLLRIHAVGDHDQLVGWQPAKPLGRGRNRLADTDNASHAANEQPFDQPPPTGRICNTKSRDHRQGAASASSQRPDDVRVK